MSMLVSNNPLELWQLAVKNAEQRCSITLESEIEAYLVTLLNRYIDRPELAKKIFATAFLEAYNKKTAEREAFLQDVGDQCLLYSGLFPQAAKQRQVKIDYFVDLGRSTYASISATASDLYGSLAFKFVVLMDVLQSLRPGNDLLPLEAYEQWQSVGSQRALKILQNYHIYPIKR